MINVKKEKRKGLREQRTRLSYMRWLKDKALSCNIICDLQALFGYL